MDSTCYYMIILHCEMGPNITSTYIMTLNVPNDETMHNDVKGAL